MCLRNLSWTRSLSNLSDSSMNYYIRLVDRRMIKSSHQAWGRLLLILSSFIYLNWFIFRLVNYRSKDDIFSLTRIHWYKPGRTVCMFDHVLIVANFVNQNASLNGRGNCMLHYLSLHFLSGCSLGCTYLLFNELLTATSHDLRGIRFQVSRAHEIRMMSTARRLLAKPVYAFIRHQYTACNAT